MAKVWYQLGDVDAERFERAGEWFEFDMEALQLDTPVGEIERLEADMDYSLAELRYDGGRGFAKAARAGMWLARHLAGCKDPYEDFMPAVFHMRISRVDPHAPEVGEGEVPPPVPPPANGHEAAAETAAATGGADENSPAGT